MTNKTSFFSPRINSFPGDFMSAFLCIQINKQMAAIKKLQRESSDRVIYSEKKKKEKKRKRR